MFTTSQTTAGSRYQCGNLKQMTYADKKEIPFVALIGENEMQEGIISLKNMLSGEQHNVTMEELVERLKR